MQLQSCQDLAPVLVASAPPGSEGQDAPLKTPDLPGSGGRGLAVAILRAGAGARARANSLEMSEFKFVHGAELSLFFAPALTPSASEPSPVLVVAALWLHPPAPNGPGGHECLMEVSTSPGSGGQGPAVGVLRAGFSPADSVICSMREDHKETVRIPAQSVLYP